MMLIGLLRTLPPKSSTAICAAVTEPWPVGVEAGPFMSVRTPILTTSSDTCASAADEASIAAVKAATENRFLANIPSPPVSFGTLAIIARSKAVDPAELVSFATIFGSPSTRPKDEGARRRAVYFGAD